MKKFLLIWSLNLIFIGSVFSQTTLISPTGGGGFELGTAYTDNGWTVVNGSANMLYVGATPTVYAGTNCSFSGSSASSWTGAATASVNHFYKSVSFPAGETSITLKFRYKLAVSDATYDFLKIWLTSSTPVAGTQLSSTQIGGTYDVALTWTEVVISVPASYAGTTTNLVFSWKTDAASPYAAVAIDNIELISKAPNPLHGVYTINNTLPTTSPMVHDGTGNYASFSEAILALNAEGITAPVTFNVSAAQVFNEKPAAITATGTSTNTITFIKSGAGANPKLTPTGILNASPYDFGFCISGGDYITFDGIDVDASSATTTTNAIEYGYLIRNASATNGAQYNTIKNCSVALNKNYVATSSSGCIYSSVSTSQSGFVPTSAAGANSYNKYYNLSLQNAQNGIYLLGNSSYPDLSCEIGVSGTGCQTSRNTITNIGGVYTFTSAYGIYVSGLSGSKIFNNDISNIRSNQSTVAGILNSTFAGTNEVYNNKISDVSNSGSTTSTSRAAGIEVQNSSGTPTIRIYNNFVSDIKSPFTSTATANIYAYGIYVNNTSTATVAEVDNNSVNLAVSGTPTYSLACFAIANSSTAVHKVRGNIFVNAVGAQGATAKHVCWYTVGTAAIGGTGSISNYNDMFVTTDAGTSGHIGRGSTTNYNTLANWTTGTTQDGNSVSLDPAFASSTNLHASATGVNAVSGFAPQAWITTDIDCDDRAAASPNDLGADAFNLASCAQPTALTASNTTYTSADLSWSAPTTGTPVGYEWEVRSSGAAGSGATGLMGSGSTAAPAVTASIAGLAGGTTYTLYVRTSCGGVDYSIWASNTFSTLLCNVPTTVAASAVTNSSANIGWIAPVVGSPEGYEYEVRTSGAAGSGATGLAASGTTTSPTVSASVSGLASATTFSVYVRTSCYAGFYSAWTSAVSFTTACNPEVAPTIVQDFSTYIGSAPQPVCWSEATGTLAASSVLTYGSSEWTNSTGFANAGTNKGVKVNLYSTGNDWIISQPIDLGATAGLYRLKYRMAVTSYNGTVAQSTLGTHKVDIVISTDGGLTWSNANIIKTYTGAGSYSNTGQDEIINLTAYSGIVKIAFVESTTLSSPDIDFHFDDFVVEALPSCAEPTSLASSSITTNSAVLNWTASISLPSSGYDYEVRTSGAAGSGSTGLVSSGSTLAGETTASISGLSANTAYNFYVRSNCGASYSPYVGPSSFYTGYCNPAPSSVDGTGITKVVFSTVSNTTGAETGNYGNYSAMVGDVGQGVLIPVNITFTTGYGYDTKIWIDWNDDLDFLDSGEEVYTGTSSAASPTTLEASFTVPPTAALGQHRMRIGGVDVGPPTPCYTGTYGSYEDYTVNVVLPPSCPNTSALAATNITVSGAELSWTENGSASKWDIEYGMTGFTPTGIPTEGFDNVDNNTHFMLEGLNSSTSYSWYVRADCSGDDTDVSAWTGPHTFVTLCESLNVPLTQNFDAVTVPSLPACWSVETHTNAWRPTDERGTYQPEAHSPYNTMTTFYSSTTAKNDWFFTAAMNLTAGVTYKLSFWYLTDGGTFGPEKLEVKYGNSASSAGMTAGQLWNNANLINSTYQEAVAYFSPSTTDVYYLGWHAYSAMDIDFLSVDDISITVSPVASTWTGSTSSDWTNSANWTAGVPGPNTNVIIPGGLTNYPALTAAGFCNNLTIQSNATGTGSIIGNSFLTVSGTTTVERYLTKYDAAGDDMFHFLSSPVSAQAIVPGFQTLSSTNTDFYSWDEITNNWTNSLLSSGWNPSFENNFTVGKGYLVAYPTDLIKTFTGSLNSGDVSPVLTFSTAGSQGWNLVGNPFASAIDWDNVAATQYSNLENAVYVWDNANQSYKTWVAGVGDLTDGIIPSMQGFFVKANAASPTLTMKDEDRVNAGSTYYKNGSVIGNMVHLRVDGNSHHDESFIRFADGANTGFDSQLDARKLSGGSQVPELASIVGETDLAVNTLPLNSLSEPVSLSLKVGADGPYTLRLIDNTLSSNYYVTLEDLKTGSMQRLNLNPEYSFTASVSDDASRFKLHFKDATSVQNPDAAATFTVKTENGILIITTEKQLSGKVNVIDMAGRILATAEMIAGTPTHINLSNHTGVYMVSVITTDGTSNQKVLVK